MQFLAEIVPRSLLILGFQNSCVSSSPSQQVQPNRGIFSRLFRRRTWPVRYRRTIRFMRADNAGNFNDQGWRTFQFEGRSAYELRMAMTRQTNEHFYFFYVTLCAWGGRCGRMTPLTADLPRCQERMDVVGLSVGSPGVNFAVFPLLCAVPVLCHLHLYSDEKCSVDHTHESRVEAAT
jgi:hypothetical protein